MTATIQERNTLDLIDRLRALSQGAEPSDPMIGICTQRDLCDLFRYSSLCPSDDFPGPDWELCPFVCAHARKWRHYSGDPLLPVPKPEYVKSWGGPEMWDSGLYGTLRRDLCRHLAESIEASLFREDRP